MKQSFFTGVCTALVTPYLGDAVNYPMLDRLIQRQIDAGIEAVVICGTTGESPTLSDSEKIQLFRRAKQFAGEHVFPVLYHIFASCGITPNFKSQKESFSNIQQNTPSSAARRALRTMSHTKTPGTVRLALFCSGVLLICSITYRFPHVISSRIGAKSPENSIPEALPQQPGCKCQ